MKTFTTDEILDLLVTVGSAEYDIANTEAQKLAAAVTVEEMTKFGQAAGKATGVLRMWHAVLAELKKQNAEASHGE